MTANTSDNGLGLSSPMNVEQIVKRAQNFDYNPSIPLKYWLRTAGTLVKEAEIYEHEGNDQQAYLLLFRHAQLVLKNLPGHSDARQPQYRIGLSNANKEVDHNLAKLEILKPRINARAKRYEELIKSRNSRNNSRIIKSSFDDPVVSLKGLYSKHSNLKDAQALDAGENRDLAIDLARREIIRRQDIKRKLHKTGKLRSEESIRHKVGLEGKAEDAFIQDDREPDLESLGQQMQRIGLHFSSGYNDEVARNTVRASLRNKPQHYSYPKIPAQYIENETTIGELKHVWDDSKSRETTKTSCGPSLPPKEPESPTISQDRSESKDDSNPSKHIFRPSAYLENGKPLRTVFLPPDLRHRFLSLALTNTHANLETCGILCGTLISNALFISKLVIPEQECTSDTCETINEDKLFDYVDNEDLMVLGWIHTHPTQSCFMSSRDLHTHSGYQAMMPESIAVVCAPSKGTWGIFRLTDPPGMTSVLNCTQKGLFHPHDETNIYTDALRPGHVFEAKGLEYDVVDLRPEQ